MKILDILTEEQRFDFDKHRATILNFINNTLAGKPTNKQYNPFYELIVGGGQVGAAGKLGIDPKIAAAWKQYFQSKPFLGGAGEPWSQINIGDQYAKATGDDRTMNFYVTVGKDRDNILKFFKNFHSLASYLQPISQQYQTPIKFKTHSLLDNFIGHNDSFKVYYYDPKLKDEVVAAVKKWLASSGVSTTTRSHEHGVDVKSGGGSFGQLLSNHVYDEFTKLIKTNGTKVTPEQYFDWLKKNLAVLIKQVKPKENMEESWSKKYKKSINCSHPKGFSQRAHCAGRKARKAGKKTKSSSVSEGVAEGLENNNVISNKIFFARSNVAPKAWSYDHVGFITQDGKQIQMSGHKGNDVYITNAVTDDPQFSKQQIKVISLSKPVLVPTTNSVGAENCGTFVANVLRANGINGMTTQKLYRIFKQPYQQDLAEGYSNTTFNINRRKLNVPALIQKGAIFVTYPHGEQGWETDNKEDWGYSLISLYNVLHGGWPSEAKKYLKPESYKKAEQQINSSVPNLGSDRLVYDGKYNQILWSIKKLGIPDDVAFLDKDQQGVAEGKVVKFVKKPKEKSDIEKYSDAFSKQHNDEHRYGVGEIECPYCGSIDCDYDCDESQADGFNENFADGKKPGRKGLAKRSGVNCKQSVSKLRSVAKNSTGEKRRMAHWCANMKSGKQK